MLLKIREEYKKKIIKRLKENKHGHNFIVEEELNKMCDEIVKGFLGDYKKEDHGKKI